MIITISSESRQFKKLELVYDDYLIIITSDVAAEQQKSESKQNNIGCRIGRQYPVSQIKGVKNEQF